MDKVQWTDYGSLKDTSINLAVDSLSLMAKSFTQKIADYVESQVKEFLKDNKEFTLEPLPLPAVFPENETGMLALVTGEYDTDGFFISRLRRNA